jgi:two-component system sensor histidine kinase BaeS
VTQPRLAGGRLSLPAKLALLALVIFAGVVTAMVPLVEATRDAPRLTLIAALALPLLAPIVIVYFLTRFIVRRMTVPLIDAYHRVGGGDFHAQLPFATGGSDFATVRAAFAAMSTALDRSIAQVKEADLDRRRLFADLAHDLATPTSTLLGISHALRDGTGDAPRLLEHLERESARLERLIADIREVAHVEDPELPMLLEPCDVGELAVRATERARISAAGVALRCEVTPAPATVDPLRIDQVLANLIDNAVRYARGGTVAVGVRVDAAAVVVIVEDSGAGVPDDVLPQLGRRLLRVDPSRSRDTGGHGLGLAIVRSIVSRHHGEVTFARSALGGLAVEVRLPAADPANPG